MLLGSLGLLLGRFWDVLGHLEPLGSVLGGLGLLGWVIGPRARVGATLVVGRSPSSFASSFTKQIQLYFFHSKRNGF